MRYEEKYCIQRGISIGVCPLKEESEHERIPSIIRSIVWCLIHCMVFPYLKGFLIIKMWLFYIVLWIDFVFTIFGDYIFGSTMVPNKLYQITFLGKKCEKIILIFAYFIGEEKEGHDNMDNLHIFFCKIYRNML
jgi:hypothetical protein